MNELGVLVLLGLAGLFLAFVVVWVVARLRAWKVRRRKIAEWARSHGLEFAPGPVDASGLAPLSTLQKSERIASSEASNMATGTSAGFRVSVFDLMRGTRSRSGGRTHSSTRYGTYALFDLGTASLPWFDFAAFSPASGPSVQGLILREVMALAKVIGGERTEDLIKLEGRPGFLLRAKDRGAVSVLFSEEALEFFDQNVGWTVEGEGSHVLVGLKPIFEGWRRPEIEELLAHEDFDRFLGVATTIAERLRRAA